MKVTLKTLKQLEESGYEGQLIARGYYQSIFNKVANFPDWKGPIIKDIHHDEIDAELNVIRHAIIYFTGNPDCTVEWGYDGRTLRIRTGGYRAGPCG